MSHPWERQDGETARAYDAFRRFREAGPLRSLGDVAEQTGTPISTIEKWSSRAEWFERAIAWDDEIHQLDDRRRLEALRTMHDTHQRAGRVAIAKAIAALNQLDPAEIPAYAAARLLELGTKLERDTLRTSVEELQGIASSTPEAEDPWDAIARELTGSG